MCFGFLKECVVSLIVPGINLFFITTFFWFQLQFDLLPNIVLQVHSFPKFHSCERPFHSSEHHFKEYLDSLNQVALQLLQFHKQCRFYLLQLLDRSVYKLVYASVFSVESGSYFVRYEYTSEFFTTRYRKFTLFLISSSWISVASVCCCDWKQALIVSNSVKAFTNDIALFYFFFG